MLWDFHVWTNSARSLSESTIYMKAYTSTISHQWLKPKIATGTWTIWRNFTFRLSCNIDSLWFCYSIHFQILNQPAAACSEIIDSAKLLIIATLGFLKSLQKTRVFVFCKHQLLNWMLTSADQLNNLEKEVVMYSFRISLVHQRAMICKLLGEHRNLCLAFTCMIDLGVEIPLCNGFQCLSPILPSGRT